ncbi:UNVERIFIED_CONTAM: hypothetical protein GTU68_010007 [Idotea baltica]|nr:hypothetical protein [Idotea baltica]
MSTRSLDLPWATFLANLISCILLGALLTLLSKSPPSVRLFWMVGFCGGFSTFSTFTAETYTLIEAGQWSYAVLNIFGSLTICLAGFFIGTKLFS